MGSCCLGNAALLSILLYSVFSSSMLLVNKLTLHFIHLPSLISLVQICFSVVFVVGAKATGLLQVDDLERGKAGTYSIYVALFAVALLCNMKSLATSNVVFSNGLLDPWSAAGVYADDAPLRPGPYVGPLAQNVSAADDVTALIIPLGAHHLDLMFMDDDDPPCARFAREFEVAAVRRWTGLA